MRIKENIPNILTLANLACGFCAIAVAFTFPAGPNGAWAAAVLLGCGLLFDFLDGLVARALKVSSPLGKELDSLADMVTFGVLPGVLVFKMLYTLYFGDAIMHPAHADALGQSSAFGAVFRTIILPALAGMVIPVFSGLRLAKFNIDTRQSHGFIGLPTPANALFFMSLYLIFCLDFLAPERTGNVVHLLAWLHLSGWLSMILLLLTGLFAWLLVSPLPLIAFKFKSFSPKENWPRFLLIAISVPLFLLLTYKAVPLVILFYFLISFIDHLRKKKDEIPG